MKTDRVTLLISPDEKASLAQKADHLGITISELMRQAALAFDPDLERDIAELALVTSEMHAAVARLQPKLELAFAEAALTRAHIERRDADTQAALESFNEIDTIDWSGVQWLFGLDASAADRPAALTSGAFRKMVAQIFDDSRAAKENAGLRAKIRRVKTAETRLEKFQAQNQLRTAG